MFFSLHRERTRERQGKKETKMGVGFLSKGRNEGRHNDDTCISFVCVLTTDYQKSTQTHQPTSLLHFIDWQLFLLLLWRRSPIAYFYHYFHFFLQRTILPRRKRNLDRFSSIEIAGTLSTAKIHNHFSRMFDVIIFWLAESRLNWLHNIFCFFLFLGLLRKGFFSCH